MLNASALDLLSRSELIERARELGVERPERMTRAELRDEILRLTAPKGQEDEARGLFGVARSMLASVVEAGLHMPDAAAVIRGESDIRVKTQPPVATVTLAEIYAAQGHRTRAVRMLDDVLAAEPDHEHARLLRQRLMDELSGRAIPEEAVPPSELVETTGEEIRTGKPPAVAVASAPESVPPSLPEPESDPEPEPTPQMPPAFEVSASPPAVEEIPPLEETRAAVEAPQVVVDAPKDAPGATFPLDAPAEDALFVEVDDRGVGLYWELSPSSLDRVRRRCPDGETVVRVVSLRPSWDGAERFERTVKVREEVGVLRLSEVQLPAVVRAVVGWQAPEGFTPLALGSDLGGEYRPPLVPRQFEAAESRARTRLEGL